MTTPVYLELGKKRIFACSLEWPGWCRAGRDEARALAAFGDYAPRYAVVAADAGVPFPRDAGQRVEVIERIEGSSTTDYGAPDRAASADAALLTGADAGRLADLLAASWRLFDRVVARAPAELRKGPRGGGRDTADIFRHVLGAETGYARAIRVRLPEPAPGDATAISAHRNALLDAFRASHDATSTATWRWLPRYAARRIAWHVLDHAWEAEDRGDLTLERAW